jgi:hypothetical protein
VINFCIPQIADVRTVSASGDIFSEIISKRFSDRSLRDIVSQGLNHDNRTHGGVEAKELDLIVQLLRHDDWVYPLHQTYAVVGIYVITLAGSVVNVKELPMIVGN